MKRNLKALGLALAAAFAISALAASAAQAQTAADFTCGTVGEGFCRITVEDHPAEGTQLVKTSIGNISCDEFHAIGTLRHGKPSDELTLTNLEYNSCNFAGLNATVDTGDCHFRLHDAETTEEGVATSPIDVRPTPEGCEITISAFGCTVTVKPQENLSSVTLTEAQTEGKPEEITGHLDLEEVAYSYSGFICGSGSAEDGVYEGTFTARAETELTGTPTSLTLKDTEA